MADHVIEKGDLRAKLSMRSAVAEYVHRIKGKQFRRIGVASPSVGAILVCDKDRRPVTCFKQRQPIEYLSQQESSKFIYLPPGETVKEAVSETIMPALSTYRVIIAGKHGLPVWDRSFPKDDDSLAVASEEINAALYCRDEIDNMVTDEVRQLDLQLLSKRALVVEIAGEMLRDWRRRFKPPRSRWWWLDELTDEEVKEIEQRLR